MLFVFLPSDISKIAEVRLQTVLLIKQAMISYQVVPGVITLPRRGFRLAIVKSDLELSWCSSTTIPDDGDLFVPAL